MTEQLHDAYTVSAPAAAKWAFALLVAQWILIPGTLKALVFFMACDYVFGLAAAFVRKDLCSSIGSRGLVKKLMILGVLMVVHMAEAHSGLELRIGEAGALGYCINEIISIIQNCATAGVPIPAQLVEALLAAKRLRMRSATPEQLRALRDDKAAGV